MQHNEHRNAQIYICLCRIATTHEIGSTCVFALVELELCYSITIETSISWMDFWIPDAGPVPWK